MKEKLERHDALGESVKGFLIDMFGFEISEN